MKITVILSSLLLSIGASVQAADYTYDWVGGAPGFAGTIVLDSSSSSGGSLSDIVSLTVTTPVSGTFGVIPDSLNGAPFTWNASQITQMSYSGFAILDSVQFNAFVAEDSPFASGHNELDVQSGPTTEPVDETGSWVAASAPDSGNSVCLLGMALAGLGSLKRSKFFAS